MADQPSNSPSKHWADTLRNIIKSSKIGCSEKVRHLLQWVTKSEFELDSDHLLQVAIGVISVIVCLAGCTATVLCLIGDELKIFNSVRALLIAIGSGYAAYYCFTTTPKFRFVDRLIRWIESRITKQNP